MAWESFELRDGSGKLLPDPARKAILRAMERAVTASDIDPAVLVRIATNIAHRIDKVKNLFAYTNRAFFRAAIKARVEEHREAAQYVPLSLFELDRRGLLEQSSDAI